jgi:hypothetical protein
MWRHPTYRAALKEIFFGWAGETGLVKNINFA